MKKLLEKKALLVSEMEQLLEKCETETRALNEGEDTLYKDKEKELRALNETIERINLKNEGAMNMNKNIGIEKRDYAQEVRELTTGSTQAVPTALADEIIRNIAEKSNLISAIPFVNVIGDLEILCEGEVQKASFLDELEALEAQDLSKFTKVKLTDKRVASEVIISKKLLNNSPAVTIDYITNASAERLANAIENSLVKLTGERNTKELSGGFDKLKKLSINRLDIANIIKGIASLKAEVAENAKIIVSRNTFIELSSLADSMGRPFIVTVVTAEKVGYQLLGLDVLISEFMEDNKVVIVNVEKAFKLKVGQAIQSQALIEKYAAIGSIGLLVDAYLDVDCIDKKAGIVLEVQTK